jgi:hypothetical protein
MRVRFLSKDSSILVALSVRFQPLACMQATSSADPLLVAVQQCSTHAAFVSGSWNLHVRACHLMPASKCLLTASGSALTYRKVQYNLTRILHVTYHSSSAVVYYAAVATRITHTDFQVSFYEVAKCTAGSCCITRALRRYQYSLLPQVCM